MTETFRTIRALQLDLAADLEPYPDLVEALDYWQRLKGTLAAAPKAAIDPIDIKKLLPRIMMCDVIRSGEGDFDFRWRLSGTVICEVHGVNLTGTFARDLYPPEYGRMIHSHYLQCVEQIRPLVHMILMSTEKKHHSYVRLLTPLLDEAGAVAYLMSVDSEKQNTLQDFLDAIERSEPSLHATSNLSGQG